MKQRPILVGMNNPISQLDGHQLYPYPPGCTGHRTLKLLRERLPDVTRHQYLETFERRNLVTGREWSRQAGREEADRMYAEFWGSGRVVVLFGEEVRKSFGHPRLFLRPQVIGGTTWRQVPHPSGRNPFYNSAENCRVVGLLLEELFVDYNKEKIDAVD